MSYKEGEGKVYFKPAHFICPALVDGASYQVILLGDNHAILAETGVFGEEHLNQDVYIKRNPSMDILTMTIPDGLYYSHYNENYDLIIRVEGVSQLMLANLKIEGNDDESNCP